MQGEKNGLNSLILQDAPSACCIHYFAHQLRLTLVALSKKHLDVKILFYGVTNVLNNIGTSFKRVGLLRILTGQELNQERGLQRSGDTRWGSHFKTLENFMIKFSSIANVLKDMKEDSPHDLDKFATGYPLDKIQEFQFIYMLHLIFKMLLLTNELNKALQKKDQEIVNAMGLLNLSKRKLKTMRESGLESLMDEVYSFCGKYDILIPNMTEDYPRSECKKFKVSYLHHFRVEVFYMVIDLQLQELNNRFDVVASDLLLGMASFNASDLFANFNKSRIMKLTEYYTSEFSDNQLRDLSYQLDNFIVYARECDRKFLNLKGIKDLADDGKTEIESNLVSYLFTCKVDIDFSCCYCKCGKSILLIEAHQK